MLAGSSVAAAGVVLYTQLGALVNLRLSSAVVDAAVMTSFGATVGGSLAALVASVVWARKALAGRVLAAAIFVGAAGLLVATLGNINVHGPSAILLFVLPFSVVDSALLLCIFVSRQASR